MYLLLVVLVVWAVAVVETEQILLALVELVD
jgi:hypothetical protein